MNSFGTYGDDGTPVCKTAWDLAYEAHQLRHNTGRFADLFKKYDCKPYDAAVVDPAPPPPEKWRRPPGSAARDRGPGATAAGCRPQRSSCEERFTRQIRSGFCGHFDDR